MLWLPPSSAEQTGACGREGCCNALMRLLLLLLLLLLLSRTAGASRRRATS